MKQILLLHGAVFTYPGSNTRSPPPSPPALMALNADAET
jgi:hypothetical protein